MNEETIIEEMGKVDENLRKAKVTGDQMANGSWSNTGNRNIAENRSRKTKRKKKIEKSKEWKNPMKIVKKIGKKNRK